MYSNLSTINVIIFYGTYKKEYWSDEEFIRIVNNRNSVSEVLRYFGLPEQQPHYRKRFYFDIKRLNLKIDYGTCQEGVDNDGKSINPNTQIKKRLIKSNKGNTKTKIDWFIIEELKHC